MSSLLEVAAAVPLLLAATACEGPPARLVAGASDTLVVNNERPARLPVRVVDARGHVLPDTGVRYARLSGDSLPVSPGGDVTCARSGDAVVRATLGGLRTDFHVLCRPLRVLRASGEAQLVLGDSAVDVPIEALGSDGRPVAQLAGTAKIMDSSVATLEGLRVRPKAPGETEVGVWAGDRFTWVAVVVFERASSPEGIRPAQNLLVPVRLASGEVRRWRLAAGAYRVAMRQADADGPRPLLAVDGAECVRPTLGYRGGFFCTVRGDASVIVYAPWRADPGPVLAGELAIQRLPDAQRPDRDP